MWQIKEHKNVIKSISKIQPEIAYKYELWKNIIYRHGPEKLKEFPGFHDEKLKGRYVNERSSRLNIQYRVIYRVQHNLLTIYVLEISPHKYKS
jgi:plasmid maintenance system killer protein